METEFYRNTWADINLDAVADNVAGMKARLPEETAMLAVVKANAYGHGALQVARTALENGAEWLAVAIFDEALALRKEGIDAPILVLSPIRPEDAGLAAQFHISLTVFQKEWIDRAVKYDTGKEPLFLHIACDTGMGRIGVRNRSEVETLIESIRQDKRFVIEGLFTHFATADQVDEVYFNEQYQRFETMIDWFHDMEVYPPVIHCGNSAATLKYPASKRHLFNMVRFGISMYGLSPSPEMLALLPYPLKPALSLYSCLMNVKKVAAGSSIGYGATYQAAEDEWIGTVPIGYADGFLRTLSGSDVLIDGKRCEIVGRVCMDQFMCRLPGSYPLGTRVTLIGRDGDESISADDRAAKMQTINYEVTCLIHPRVPRVYWKRGKRVGTSNPLLAKASKMEKENN
ncbi:MAG: alanine racemase [Sporolactobacillus sp.]